MVEWKGRFRGVKQNLKRAHAFWNRSFWKKDFGRQRFQKRKFAEKNYLKNKSKR
jgi:hypothetical protein